MLARGQDPMTTEMLSRGNPVLHPDVVEALEMAAEALQVQRKEKRTKSKQRAKRKREQAERIAVAPWLYQKPIKAERPARVGKPWTEDEDQQLLDLYAAGQTLHDMAQRLERTEFSIAVRLFKLGIEP
ncbi:MAG: hypothetical protein KDA58_11090 [Planctomycetaceae bacterium]|nr:hypothetical protein [Planctomycetaceae bacterium]